VTEEALSCGQPRAQSSRDHESVLTCQGRVLTVEMALYGGLFLGALLTRLVDIGRWPLLEGELGSALAALRAVRGSPARPAYYVPLLVDANIVLFWLTHASEGVTRLLPALAGGAVTLLPYTLRGLVGRVGALSMAALMAFSPCWLFHSRLSDAPILAAFLGLGFAASVWRFRATGDPRSMRCGATALGLGLTVGGGVYTLLLALLVAGLSAAAMEHGWRPGWRRVWACVRRMWDETNLALLGGSFFLVSTAGLANPEGLGQSIALAGDWVRALYPAASDVGPIRQVLILGVYEPLTVALAIVGGAWAVRRRDPLRAGIVLWAVVTLVLATALGHREPPWVLDALLPLVFLAGMGAERVWRMLRNGLSVYDWVAIFWALVLLGFAFLALASYLRVGHGGWRGYALVTAGALALGWAALFLWAPDQAERVGAVVLGVLLVGVTVRAGTALTYQTGRDPRELLLTSTTSVQVRDLEGWVARGAALQGRDPVAYEVVYERALEKWMEWLLRDYTLARPHSGLATEAPSDAVITRVEAQASWPVGDYAGQSFCVRETWNWSADDLTWRERLHWLVYRAPVGEGCSDNVILWMRRPAGAQ